MRLPSSVPLDTDLMLRTLDRTNANLAVIADEVRVLAGKLNQPGNAVDLLTDTVLAADLSAALVELRAAAENARTATAGIDALMGDVRSGKGALGALVSDPASEQQVRALLGNLQHVSDSLQALTNGLGSFARDLNSTSGLAHSLLTDTALAGDVRRTIGRLDTGTLLLNEDLRALQRNWLFRRYFKEKAKARNHEGRQRPRSPARAILQPVQAAAMERAGPLRGMEFGIYTFVDHTPDPVTGERIPAEQRHRNLLEEAMLADRLGLDVFGIGEHHRPDFIASAPSVLLAAIAARTQRIRLTSAVTVLSSEDPVRVFQQYATLDLLSNGRAEIMAGRDPSRRASPCSGTT